MNMFLPSATSVGTSHWLVFVCSYVCVTAISNKCGHKHFIGRCVQIWICSCHQQLVRTQAIDWSMCANMNMLLPSAISAGTRHWLTYVCRYEYALAISNKCGHKPLIGLCVEICICYRHQQLVRAQAIDWHMCADMNMFLPSAISAGTSHWLVYVCRYEYVIAISN